MKKPKWEMIGQDVSSAGFNILDANRPSRPAYFHDQMNFYSTNDKVRQEIEYANKLMEWYTWYEGRIPQLRKFYQILDIERYRFLGGDKNCFWKQVTDNVRMVHTGLPQIISHAMSELMMATGIEISRTDKKLWSDEELETINLELQSIGLNSCLSEVAVNCSWAGTGFIKWDFNEEVSIYPIPSSVSPMNIRIFSKNSFPFRADIFVEKVSKNNITYLLIEKREIEKTADSKNSIMTVKYYLIERKSISYEFKSELELSELTKNNWRIVEELGLVEKLKQTFEFNTDSLLITAIPNKLPNPIVDGLTYGISDYFGLEEMFDCLDEIRSLWMDSIRKGKMKTYVPKTLLPRDKDGNVRRYRAFGLDYITTYEMSENPEHYTIRHEVPDIDYEAFADNYNEFVTSILIKVGLTPYTVGMQSTGLDGRDLSDRKERYSARTRENKRKLWEPYFNKIIKDYIIAKSLWLNKTNKKYLKDVKGIFARLKVYNIPTFESRAEFWQDLRDKGGCDLETMIDKIYIDNTPAQKRRMIRNIRAEQGIDSPEDAKRKENFGRLNPWATFKNQNKIENVESADVLKNPDGNKEEDIKVEIKDKKENNKDKGIVKKEERGK